ncbi:MAG TPA: hypothetical protein VGC73_15700 [Pyrinomonadaceae bacterium]
MFVLNRQLSQPSVQFPKRYEATARMLLEKAQKFAPEFVPSLNAELVLRSLGFREIEWLKATFEETPGF